MMSEVTISHGFYQLLSDKASSYDKIRAQYQRSDITDAEKIAIIQSLIEDSFNLI